MQLSWRVEVERRGGTPYASSLAQPERAATAAVAATIPAGAEGAGMPFLNEVFKHTRRCRKPLLRREGRRSIAGALLQERCYQYPGTEVTPPLLL